MWMKNTFERGFEGMANTEFLEVLLHKELTGSSQVLLKQKQSTRFWEG